MPSRTSRRDFLTAAATAAVLPAAISGCDRSTSEAPEPTPTAAPLDIDWGFPPEAVRVGLNESPLGPSPVAAAAMSQAIPHSNRYVRSFELEQKLAARHRVPAEWIALGCGSTEILRDLPRTIHDRPARVVAARESYRELVAEARRLELSAILVPVDAEHRHDLPAMLAAVDPTTRMMVVTNPNNPTGTTLPRTALEGLAEKLPPSVTLVVDQAYIGFAPDADVTDLVSRFRNLLVVHTFSKLYGLAGIRVGYAVGHPTLLAPLRRLSLRNHINLVGYVGARAALDDTDYPGRYRALAAESRAFFARELAARKLPVVTGDAPFLLVDIRPHASVVDRLAEHDVFVRSGRDWDLPGWIRISHGTMDQNRAVIAALDQVLA